MNATPALRRTACIASLAFVVALPATAGAERTAADSVHAHGDGAAQASAGRRVYYRSFSQDHFSAPKYRPSSIRFGERSLIHKIRWSRWNGSVARGKGILVFNSCRPNCADARPQYFAVRISLSSVGVCGPRYEYFRFAFRFADRPPTGYGKSHAERHGC